MRSHEIEDSNAFKLDSAERMWRKIYAAGLATKAELDKMLALIEESRQVTTCCCPIEPDDPNHDIDDCLDAAAAVYHQKKHQAENRRKQRDLVEKAREQRGASV